LESLCLTCGLGLILFDSRHASEPRLLDPGASSTIQPDMFYVNRNLKLIEQRIFD
jgi:hypothetical protein